MNEIKITMNDDMLKDLLMRKFSGLIFPDSNFEINSIKRDSLYNQWEFELYEKPEKEDADAG